MGANRFQVFSDGEVGRMHVLVHRLTDERRYELGHRFLGDWLDGARKSADSDHVHMHWRPMASDAHPQRHRKRKGSPATRPRAACVRHRRLRSCCRRFPREHAPPFRRRRKRCAAPTVRSNHRVRRRCISLRDLADVSSRRLVDVSDVGHGAAYLGCDRPPFGEEREAVSRLLDLAALTPLVGDLPPPRRART